MFRGLDAGGDWSIHFPPHEGINCYSVVTGHCWLRVDGFSETVCIKSGDCILLPRGQSFVLASDTTVKPMDAITFFSGEREGGIATYNGGGDVFGIGGYFDFAGKHANVLLSVLPAVVHIRKESDKAVLRWSMELMMDELREPKPGGFLVAQHLAHLMLVQALRLYLEEGSSDGVGWLFALADKQMSAAINAIHDDPAHRWTLQALAKLANMSRSTFAQKFKETVGASPIEYLTRWRMLLAGDKLTNSNDPIAIIALSLGYESESAFSTAFKRVMGCSPRRYNHVKNVASPSLKEEVNFLQTT
nr:AraC family transcriptional regulator [Pseudanabaena sp. 'Roaring Creek']